MPNQLQLPPAAQQWIDRIGGPRRAGILAMGIASVLLILGVARWATAPAWVPVFSDLPLESVGTITERLDEEGIAYELGGGGTELRVAATDLARARVALAKDGGMPNAGRPGLEIFDQPAWGMTDFTQRVNYRRALEGELERTIGEMRGVEAVKVHVAMEEAVGFRRNGRPSEASVVMKLSNGSSPSAEMVQGISHLVASSVDGVEAERVMILDDTGRLLSSPDSPDSPAALASRELRIRSEIEQYLATKAEELVARVVGPGNVRVQVAAEINLDRVERTTESVDPEQQALSSEQRSEIIPGAEGGAGSSSVTNTFVNTRSMETYTGAIGNVKRLTAAVLINDREVVAEDGTVTYEPRGADEIQQIQAMVGSALGMDTSRGDVLSVTSFQFEQGVDLVEEPVTPLQLVEEFHRPGIALLALLLAFFLAMRITKSLRQPAKAERGALKGRAAGNALNVLVGENGEAVAGLESGESEGMLPPSPPTPRDLVAAQIEQSPEVAAKLIRTWLREEA
jgi:flagellar M-ring protein FliF